MSHVWLDLGIRLDTSGGRPRADLVRPDAPYNKKTSPRRTYPMNTPKTSRRSFLQAASGATVGAAAAPYFFTADA